MQLPDSALDKLLLILHRAFVEVRNRSEPGSPLHELADTFEVIPELMTRPTADTLEQVRSILMDYQARRSASGYEYLALLDEVAPEIVPFSARRE